MKSRLEAAANTAAGSPDMHYFLPAGYRPTMGPKAPAPADISGQTRLLCLAHLAPAIQVTVWERYCPVFRPTWQAWARDRPAAGELPGTPRVSLR